MEPSVERKKAFIKAIYIRDFKNTISKVYTSVVNLSFFPDDKNTEAVTIPILKRNIPTLIELFNKNVNRIIIALRTFKDLRDIEEYKIISALWTQILPNAEKDLENLLLLISSSGFSELKKEFYMVIKRVNDKFKNVDRLFKELQNQLGYISHAERRRLDGLI